MKMTDEQRVLFSEIAILNLEYFLEKDSLKKWEKLKKLRSKKLALQKSMGNKQYEKWVKMGRAQYEIKQHG
jgi:hypothetical protein